MKNTLLIALCFLTFGITFAQEVELSKEEKERREKNIQAGNPFAEFGYEAKVATLSKGKYLEVHDLDSIVIIGSSLWHVKKQQIVGKVEQDTTDIYRQPLFDTAGRWLSPDPLAEEFPEWSPYNFTYNNPMRYIDPTGLAPEDIFQVDQKGKITQIEAEGEDVLVVVDKKGNEISERVNIGDDANLLEFGDTQVLEISDQDKANNAFVEVSNNTGREFALINKEDTSSGDKSSAIVGDGKRSENSGDIIAKGLYDGIGNIVVTDITHNHPKNSPPSGYNPRTGENLNPNAPIGDARNATTYPTNSNGDPITRKVYTPKNGKTYTYDNQKFYPAKSN